MNSREKIKMGKGKAKKVNRDLTSEQFDIVTHVSTQIYKSAYKL